MNNFARVADGQVRELIQLPEEIELDTIYHPELLATLVPIAAGQDVVEGWLYDGEDFSAPPAPAPPARTNITPREFRLRFTAAERAALTLAASQTLQAGDPTLQVFLDDLSASQAVELDHPEILAGMAAIVAGGLISQARASEILTA